ncbi:MAG: type VI secretion system amidase effector protein Tae4 [Betaproteobacteria bacterium]|jgi:hypothetical protein|nr:type VI secretion system amidase effector protein Tae4 [Betaproteobacteria bacterium]
MPNFARLKANHYSSDADSPDYKDREGVYKEIGYDANALIRQNDAYQNTCAVRMSLALLKSGVHFGTPSSWLRVKDGTYKGRSIGTGAKTLADALRKPTVLGEPLTGEKAAKAMETRKGIVFFHNIPGYGGGHIDLIEPSNICHSRCYFDTGFKEIWFWPVD